MTAPDPLVDLPYWPPTLGLLKVDGEITDNRKDDKLSLELAAAVDYVQRVRRDVDYTGLMTGPELVAAGMRRVTVDHMLGTCRLALRWHARGRSPDGMIASPDTGSVRVSSGDSDIDKMLRIGRYARPIFGRDVVV